MVWLRNQMALIWFGSKSKVADLKQLGTNIVVELMNSIRDLSVILDSELLMRRHVGKLLSICLFFTSVACIRSGGCLIVVATTTRFCIHPVTHCLLQRRACWPANLHTCTSSACSERSSMVHRWSATVRSHHQYTGYTGYRSLIGFVTCSVL